MHLLRLIYRIVVSYMQAKRNICAMKSLIFIGSCSNFDHFSLKIGHIFLQNLKNSVFKNKNSLYLSIITNCRFSDKHAKKGEKAQNESYKEEIIQTWQNIQICTRSTGY